MGYMPNLICLTDDGTAYVACPQEGAVVDAVNHLMDFVFISARGKHGDEDRPLQFHPAGPADFVDELIDLSLKMVSMDLFQRPTLSSSLDRIQFIKKMNVKLFDRSVALGYYNEQNGNYVQEYDSLDDMRNKLDEMLPTDSQQALNEAKNDNMLLISVLNTCTAEHQVNIAKIADFQEKLTETKSELETIEQNCGYYNKDNEYVIEFESVNELREAYNRAIHTVRQVNTKLKDASLGADIREDDTTNDDELQTLRSHIDVIIESTRSPPVHQINLQIDEKKFEEQKRMIQTLAVELENCKRGRAGVTTSRHLVKTANRGIENLMTIIK
jgi:hypothetical protein